MKNSPLSATLDRYSQVYGALLVLTALTVGVYFLHLKRVPAIGLALLIAGLKIAFIGWFFMHLNRERALVRWILAIGILAVLILGIGIIPDLAWRWS